MKEMMKIRLGSGLCGLVMLTALMGAGNVHANTVKLQPIQVQNTGYTDSMGTITVSATCPSNFHVQSGTAQISGYNQTQQPMYAIQANGPGTQGNVWTTTIANKTAGSLNITVTATCAENQS